MACGSNQSGLESKHDALILDPLLSSWMTREPPSKETSEVSADDEGSKKDKDSESEIRELFRIFDKNHDNTISCGELGKMLRCMGMDVTEEDVENIMKDLDKNGNGKIEYREFKSFMQEEMKRSEESPREQERAIRMAFQVFDKTGEGFIDCNELRSAMKTLGEPLSDREISDMMTGADMDKDGRINYDAFVTNWMKSSNRKETPSEEIERPLQL